MTPANVYRIINPLKKKCKGHRPEICYYVSRMRNSSKRPTPSGGAKQNMPKSSSRRYIEEDFQASSSLPLWREALLGMDWISLRMSAVYRGIGVPKGDGSAVIVRD